LSGGEREGDGEENIMDRCMHIRKRYNETHFKICKIGRKGELVRGNNQEQ
jgi:hypothetical protein